MIREAQLLTHVPFPWQRTQWQHLTRLYRNEQLPHAFLVSGNSGLGKSLFVNKFARFMLCKEPLELLACDKCKNCLRFGGAAIHPDILSVQSEEGKRDIVIDQVRSLIEFVAYTSHTGGVKIVIIAGAHHLNLNSANALLKTLEEPTSNRYFFLITDMPGSLPATIRSRCQRLLFAAPSKKSANQWLTKLLPNENTVRVGRLLNAAQYRPLNAMGLAQQDILEEQDQFLEKLCLLSSGGIAPQSVVATAVKIGELSAINYLVKTSSALIKSLITLEQPVGADLNNLHQLFLKQRAPLTLQIFKLLMYYDEALTAYKHMTSSSNPNGQLIVETLIWHWHELT
tara:strand:- start:261 stop:1283 length:1023 start_codon:yes stop_codon:yes gene_type:complete